METCKPIPTTLKAVTYLLLLVLTISWVSSARILEAEQSLAPAIAPVIDVSPVETPPIDNPVETPAIDVPPVVTPPITVPIETPVADDVPPVVAPPISSAAVTSSPTAAAADTDPHHPLSFFMHENGAILPMHHGLSVNNGNNRIIDNKDLPLTGLSGTTSTLIQSNDNNLINGEPGLPSAKGPQLPFQKLMFGTMTVIDDELTEGHELGSGLVGKAQGFYVVTSEDGSSRTMLFTVMFNSENYADTLSFFGIHNTASLESQLAIMGGTGKYVNAKGFATIKRIPTTNQHSTTNGAETLLQFTVYLA